MLFNSFPFLFGFLPITCIVFFVLARISHVLAAGWLTLASIAFYAWWNPAHVGLLLASVILNYTLGAQIARARAQGRIGASRAWLAGAVAINLFILAYYKYLGFILASLDAVVGARWNLGEVVLPLGVSFFTFTQIAFLVDAQRGQIAGYPLLHYALFVTYFPHLIAGPILRHDEVIPQLGRHAIYRVDPKNLATGLTILCIGLFKKVLLADTAGMYSAPAFAAAARGETLSFIAAWGGALAYTFQLYFDFSGYSDMAIGMSRLLGIDLPLNFASPYRATSIIDFWRRWHMTLSRFLRDYLYIPLGGSHHGSTRRYLNLLLTMLLGGLWHGAGWTFVAWGGLHGVYLVVNHGWRAMRRARRHETGSSSPWWRHVSRVLTFLAVVVAWVFFRANSFQAAWRMLIGMCGIDGFAVPPYFDDVAVALVPVSIRQGLRWTPSPVSILVGILAALLAIVWLAPNTQQIMGPYGRALDPYPTRTERPPVVLLRWRPSAGAAVLASVLFSLSLLGLLTAIPPKFLYFQF